MIRQQQTRRTIYVSRRVYIGPMLVTFTMSAQWLPIDNSAEDWQVEVESWQCGEETKSLVSECVKGDAWGALADWLKTKIEGDPSLAGELIQRASED